MRARVAPLLAGALTLAAGLTVDATASGPVADKAGDVLYALLVVSGLWLLRPAAPVLALAGAALAWCVGVELLQLTELPRALAQRVPPVRLVLGSGFDALDLPAYALGCAAGAGLVRSTRTRPVARVGAREQAGR